jgi:hypothetical protein
MASTESTIWEYDAGLIKPPFSTVPIATFDVPERTIKLFASATTPEPPHVGFAHYSATGFISSYPCCACNQIDRPAVLNLSIRFNIRTEIFHYNWGIGGASVPVMHDIDLSRCFVVVGNNEFSSPLLLPSFFYPHFISEIRLEPECDYFIENQIEGPPDSGYQYPSLDFIFFSIGTSQRPCQLASAYQQPEGNVILIVHRPKEAHDLPSGAYLNKEAFHIRAALVTGREGNINTQETGLVHFDLPLKCGYPTSRDVITEDWCRFRFALQYVREPYVRLPEAKPFISPVVIPVDRDGRVGLTLENQSDTLTYKNIRILLHPDSLDDVALNIENGWEKTIPELRPNFKKEVEFKVHGIKKGRCLPRFHIAYIIASLVPQGEKTFELDGMPIYVSDMHR